MDARRPACAIVNPAAGRGRGAQALPAIRRSLQAAGIVDIRTTRGPGDERVLARVAALEGIDTIVAVGGDGTWSNAARGILESGRDARLAILAAGTGNDFAHALGVPARDSEAMARAAAGGREVRIDVGRIANEYFLNVAGIGIDAEVLEVSRRIRLLKGPLVYVAAALSRLVTFRPMQAAIETEHSPAAVEAPYLAVIAANGPVYGGGFHVAPAASITDGYLDLITVRDMPILQRAAVLNDVRAGRHIGRPDITHLKVRSARFVFEQPPLINLDGELFRAPFPVVVLECAAAMLRVAIP